MTPTQLKLYSRLEFLREYEDHYEMAVTRTGWHYVVFKSGDVIARVKNGATGDEARIIQEGETAFPPLKEVMAAFLFPLTMD